MENNKQQYDQKIRYEKKFDRIYGFYETCSKQTTGKGWIEEIYMLDLGEKDLDYWIQDINEAIEDWNKNK